MGEAFLLIKGDLLIVASTSRKKGAAAGPELEKKNRSGGKFSNIWRKKKESPVSRYT